MSRADLNVIGIRQVVVCALDESFSVKTNEDIRLDLITRVGRIANRHKIGVIDVRGKNIEACRHLSDIA